jgi:opacity protein-like surface antigen
MRKLACILLVLSTLPLAANAQFAKRNVEFNGGWAHITGDQGLDGLNAGAALYFTPRVSIAFDYDAGWDTSTIGAFAITQVGQVSTHSSLQDILLGPRIFFPGLLKGKGGDNVRLLKFFGEAEFGGSHLSSTIKAPTLLVNQNSSDTAFTWLVGGGVDYRLSPHWTARGKMGLERTHFVNEGQSRLRTVVGVSYAFGRR